MNDNIVEGVFPPTPKCTCDEHEDATNVVDMPEPPRYIAVCNECQCRSFELISDGTIECCNCHKIPEPYGEEVEWRKILPPVPDNPDDVEDDGDTVGIRAMGAVDLAVRSTMKMVNDWVKDNTITILVAFDTNGAGKHWLNINTEEQKQWVLRKIRSLVAHVEKTDLGD